MHLFVYFARVIFYPFSLPLGVRGLPRLVILALPRRFYKLFWIFSKRTDKVVINSQPSSSHWKLPKVTKVMVPMTLPKRTSLKLGYHRIMFSTVKSYWTWQEISKKRYNNRHRWNISGKFIRLIRLCKIETSVQIYSQYIKMIKLIIALYICLLE